MENHHASTVHQHEGKTKKNIYNEADPSTCSDRDTGSLATTHEPIVSSWLPTINSTISSLLDWAGSYPAYTKESHLLFVREAVVPRLKQPPVAADRLHYILTHNNSPYEASVALAPQKPTKVRFTVQPLADVTSADPLGQKRLRENLEGLASACDADRSWLDAFVDCVFLTPEEEAGLVQNEANGAAVLPRQICYAGFDLEPGEDEDKKATIGMKAYLFPQLKALAMGKKLVEITEAVLIRLANGDEGMLAAWELLGKFLVSQGENEINIYFLAIDCLARGSETNSEPRLKIYVHTRANSLASARQVFTLGGRLLPSASDFLPQVWPLLMDMEDIPQTKMENFEKPLNYPDSKYCGLCFAFEISPGKAVPQVKMYVPMWQYARNEAGLVKRYERILQNQAMIKDCDLGAGVQDAL